MSDWIYSTTRTKIQKPKIQQLQDIAHKAITKYPAPKLNATRIENLYGQFGSGAYSRVEAKLQAIAQGNNKIPYVKTKHYKNRGLIWSILMEGENVEQ